MNNPWVDVVYYGLMAGCAWLFLSLALWLAGAVSRTFPLSLAGGYVAGGAALSLTASLPLPIRIAIAIAASACAGSAAWLVCDWFKLRNAGLARQLLVSVVLLELILALAAAVAGAQPATLVASGGTWMRGAIGATAVLIPVLLLQTTALGKHWRLVLADPKLSDELGVPVRHYEWVAFLLGGAMCGLAAVCDALDGSVGAGPRAAFPAIIAASLAVLVAEAVASRESYLTVTAVSLLLSIATALFGFLLADGDRLLAPLLLVIWLAVRSLRGQA